MTDADADADAAFEEEGEKREVVDGKLVRVGGDGGRLVLGTIPCACGRYHFCLLMFVVCFCG